MEVGPRAYHESNISEAIICAAEYSYVQICSFSLIIVDCYTLSQFRTLTVAEIHLCLIDVFFTPWPDFDKHANWEASCTGWRVVQARRTTHLNQVYRWVMRYALKIDAIPCWWGNGCRWPVQSQYFCTRSFISDFWHRGLFKIPVVVGAVIKTAYISYFAKRKKNELNETR